MLSMAYFVQWFFGRLIEFLGKIFFSLRFERLEHLKECDLPVIFVSNHKSWIDHFIIIAGALRRRGVVPIHVLVADKIYARPVVGTICKMLGAYPARYKSGLDVSLAPLINGLKRGECVGLYPEGKINLNHNEFGSPRPGAARLAIKTGRPGLPLAIKGLEGFSWESLFFGRRKVSIRFGSPFFINENLENREGVDSATKLIMEEIISLYNGIQ